MSNDKNSASGNPQNQDPAAALDAKNSGLTEEQRQHREELYGYKKDEEGTLDTSEQLADAMSGTPSGSATTGPDPDSESTNDELRITGFNNPIDDNNR